VGRRKLESRDTGKRALSEFRQVLEIEIYVVSHVEIKVAIIVIIAPKAALVPTGRYSKTSFAVTSVKVPS